MLIQGIINPEVLSLVSRVRHTNALVIADAAFPFWPEIETVDISLVKGVPSVLQVVNAILPNWKCGEVYMAEEFKRHNQRKTQAAFARACGNVPITFRAPHRVQEEGSARDRPDPHRRYHRLREHDPGVGLSGLTPPPPWSSSAVTVSLVPEAKGGPFVFWEDLSAAAAQAAASGFDAIEIFPRSGEALDALPLEALLASYKLKLAAVGTGAGWVVRRLSLTDPLAEARAEARRFVGSHR